MKNKAEGGHGGNKQEEARPGNQIRESPSSIQEILEEVRGSGGLLRFGDPIQKIVKKTLDALDKKPDPTSFHIPFRDLRLVVNQLGDMLTDQQRETIINYAEAQGDMEFRLPNLELVTPGPRVTMPSKDVLEKLLPEMSEQELSDTMEWFVKELRLGMFPVFVNGCVKNTTPEENQAMEDAILREKVDWFSEAERRELLNAIDPRRRQGYGERTWFSPKLLHGLMSAQKLLPAGNIKDWCKDYMPAQQVMAIYLASRDDDPRCALARRNYEGGATYDADIPLYSPPSDADRQKGRVPQDKVNIGEINGELDLVYEKHQIEQGVKSFNVVAKRDFADDGRGGSYVQFTILMCRSHFIYNDKDNRGYQRVLRALRTNPAFLIEALQRFIPEALEGNMGNYYLAATENPVRVYTSELNALGVPLERPFAPISIITNIPQAAPTSNETKIAVVETPEASLVTQETKNFEEQYISMRRALEGYDVSLAKAPTWEEIRKQLDKPEVADKIGKFKEPTLLLVPPISLDKMVAAVFSDPNDYLNNVRPIRVRFQGEDIDISNHWFWKEDGFPQWEVIVVEGQEEVLLPPEVDEQREQEWFANSTPDYRESTRYSAGYIAHTWYRDHPQKAYKALFGARAYLALQMLALSEERILDQRFSTVIGEKASHILIGGRDSTNIYLDAIVTYHDGSSLRFRLAEKIL